MKNSLLIIQEILPTYRLEVFNQIAKVSSGPVSILSDSGSADFGNVDTDEVSFVFFKANWHKFLGIFKNDWQAVSLWFKHDVTLHVADFKFLSLWILLLLSFISNKKFYLHGQGGYKNKGLVVNIVYSIVLFFCDGYICYTEYSKASLKSKVPRFLHHKISVCDNTLDIIPVNLATIDKSGSDLFYIGRLRIGCEIENLLLAATKSGVHVQVIGSGDVKYLSKLKAEFSSIATFHGIIFDEHKQREIAKTCFAGAYGGDAGLSVVHYMALGLPVIVHGNADKHMGPEPSYVIDGVNGLLFERNNINSLSDKITELASSSDLRYELAKSALETFKKLQTPSMASKFVTIMGLLK